MDYANPDNFRDPQTYYITSSSVYRHRPLGRDVRPGLTVSTRSPSENEE